MKSNIKKVDSAVLSEKLAGFFSARVEETARETKFVRRTSTVSGLNFLTALVLGFLEKPGASLNELAQSFLDVGVEVSPQGIDERINSFSVAFLRALLAQALETFKADCPLPLSIVEQFSAVYIVDSSTKALPASRADEYPGCGRQGAAAELKIQLVFDFLHGNLEQVEIQAGTDTDQGYREYLKVVQGGSLTIVDLGYFCLDAFWAMTNQSAYFLSRYLYPTALFDPAGERMDLVKLLKKQTAASADWPVSLGRRCPQALPCRLILLRNPDPVTEQRRRKAKEHARKRGRTLSRNYLSLLGWTLFVTNAPASMVSLQHIYDLYRVRWQIELIFKLWKSYCGLNLISSWRRERVLTELYAKMIGIVLLHFLLAPLRVPDEIWSEREVSQVRFRKLIERFARRIKHNISQALALAQTLDLFWLYVQRFSLKQKRSGKPNAYAQLAKLVPATSLA
jgi:hypothetical protein